MINAGYLTQHEYWACGTDLPQQFSIDVSIEVPVLVEVFINIVMNKKNTATQYIFSPFTPRMETAASHNDLKAEHILKCISLCVQGKICSFFFIAFNKVQTNF